MNIDYFIFTNKRKNHGLAVARQWAATQAAHTAAVIPALDYEWMKKIWRARYRKLINLI